MWTSGASGCRRRPNTEVERQGSAREEPVRGSRAEREHAAGNKLRGGASHVLATIAADLPGRVIQNRPQACVAGRLKRTRQPPLRLTMKWPTCIDLRARSPAQRTKTWP